MAERVPQAESGLVIGAWTGGLGELVTALEQGTLGAAEISIAELVAQVRALAQDTDTAATAYAQLARVIELKARSLLPEPPLEPEAPAEEEDAAAEAAALAERVAAYRAFAEAAAALRAFERERGQRFGRPAAPAAKSTRPAPAESAPGETVERLLGVFAEVWERAKPRTRDVLIERRPVAVVAAELRVRLAALGSAEFSELFAADADRLEVVVTFLALLELVRLGEVAVVQSESLGPLRIGWRGGRGRS